jgi:DegV family protein with EDD domain
MTKISYLDGFRFYRGLLAGGKEVIKHQDYLNNINVYPVADADTGMNLAMTMQAILERSRIGKTLKETLHSVAESALTGARGNSGIIFAQYLHGLSRELPENRILTAKLFAESASKAVKSLYDSLMNPVEGTMLTVIREWADYLQEHSGKTADFMHLLTDSLATARKSLQETPAKLKVLAEAGVVDAGASGFVYFLEGVVNFMHKGSLRDNSFKLEQMETYITTDMHTEKPGDNRYCMELILKNCSCSLISVKGIIGGLGDSIILAGEKEQLHIHIHTQTPDRVYHSLLSNGEISYVKVDDMLRQYQISNSRKSNIGLITDSACDLPPELMDKYQIAQVPFGIAFGNRQYLDGLTLKSDGFYKLLKGKFPHPVSSQPSPMVLQGVMDFVARHYEKSIALFISDHLSGVHQNALALAKKRRDDRIMVINSRQLSVSQGLVMLRIARAVEAGMSHNTILDNVNSWIDNTQILTDINTLKYMVRGGRVKPLTGMIASVLNLKPIVSLDKEGKAKPIGKSFSRRSNMNRIIGMIAARMKRHSIWEYAIVHADAPERAEEYALRLSKLTGKKPAYITSLSPVVGVHNGIGAVAIGVAYDISK